MSALVGLESRAAIEAIEACDRLLPTLADVVAQHEHAASVARPDWSGPHHDRFEERFVSLQRELEGGRAWVLRVRHDAAVRLAVLEVQAREAAAALARTGQR